MQTNKLREALAELVALKDIEDIIEAILLHEARGGSIPAVDYAAMMDLIQDYNKREPLAWAAARTTLNEGDSEV